MLDEYQCNNILNIKITRNYEFYFLNTINYIFENLYIYI